MSRGGSLKPYGAPCWASALAAVALSLATIIALPWEHRHEFSRDFSPLESDAPRDTATYTRSNIALPALDGTKLAAWLYLPKGIERCAQIWGRQSPQACVRHYNSLGLTCQRRAGAAAAAPVHLPHPRPCIRAPRGDHGLPSRHAHTSHFHTHRPLPTSLSPY